MWIILEGPDGAGKSSLASRLFEQVANHGPTTLLHRGPPNEHPLLEYELALETYEPGAGHHVIADRWHLGELIYGPIYRGESLLEGPGATHVELLRHARGAITVVLLPSLDILKRRVEDRGDDYIDLRDLDKIRDEYRTLTLTKQVDVVIGRSPQQEDLQLIIGQARLYERLARKMTRFSSYVGPPFPNTLYLGEKRGGRQTAHRSAFVPYRGTSGHFLLEALNANGAGNYALANALEEDVEALLETVRPKRVVTLGRVAQDRLQSYGIPCASAPHPQYVRRFHHKMKEEYGLLLCTLGPEEDASQWPR